MRRGIVGATASQFTCAEMCELFATVGHLTSRLPSFHALVPANPTASAAVSASTGGERSIWLLAAYGRWVLRLTLRFRHSGEQPQGLRRAGNPVHRLIKYLGGLGPSPHLKTRWGRPRWDDGVFRGSLQIAALKE